ncbi:MAG: hypothetical protein WBX81_10375, partial [Nitrososphaeraceae archaeon]
MGENVIIYLSATLSRLTWAVKYYHCTYCSHIRLRSGSITTLLTEIHIISLAISRSGLCCY